MHVHVWLSWVVLGLLGSVAQAGTVRIETEVPIEVTLKGLPVAKSYSAGVVSLSNVDAGEHELQVWRDGKAEAVRLTVPEQGEVRLLVGAANLSVVDASGVTVADGPAPTVVVSVDDAGQRFALVVDGERQGLVLAGSPLELADLAPGVHAIEVRSDDHLTIWARGQLELRPGDAIAVKLYRGRMPEVFGRAGAWSVPQPQRADQGPPTTP